MVAKKSKSSSSNASKYAETVYRDLVAELRAEITRIKTAHAEELARVIEENKKLIATLEGAAVRSTDRTDQKTESGSSDSQPPEPTTEASMSDLLAMLHNGTPFQRIIARSQLDQIDHQARKLGNETAKLKREFDTMKLEVEKLQAENKELKLPTPKPEAAQSPAN